MAERKSINIDEVLKNVKNDTFESADIKKEIISKAVKPIRKVAEPKYKVTVYVTGADLEKIDEYCSKNSRSRAFFYDELLQNWIRSNVK